MRVRSNCKLSNNPFRRHPRLVEMAEHLIRLSLRRSVCSSDLDRVILGVVAADGFYVCGYLAVFELEQAFKGEATRNRRVGFAWRTVTGMRAPWSVHRTVMPRFRAMTPVRIEFGVHFGGEAGFEELGWEEARAMVEECIRRASGGFSANAHSLSMERGRDANRADHKIILYSIPVSSGSSRRPCSLLIRITVPIKIHSQVSDLGARWQQSILHSRNP